MNQSKLKVGQQLSHAEDLCNEPLDHFQSQRACVLTLCLLVALFVEMIPVGQREGIKHRIRSLGI